MVIKISSAEIKDNDWIKIKSKVFLSVKVKKIKYFEWALIAVFNFFRYGERTSKGKGNLVKEGAEICLTNIVNMILWTFNFRCFESSFYTRTFHRFIWRPFWTKNFKLIGYFTRTKKPSCNTQGVQNLSIINSWPH